LELEKYVYFVGKFGGMPSQLRFHPRIVITVSPYPTTSLHFETGYDCTY